jgi:hypothetical protein
MADLVNKLRNQVILASPGVNPLGPVYFCLLAGGLMNLPGQNVQHVGRHPSKAGKQSATTKDE